MLLVRTWYWVTISFIVYHFSGAPLIITDFQKVGGPRTCIFLLEVDAPDWGRGTTPDPSDFLPTAYHRRPPPPPRQMPTTSARPRGSQGRITGPPAGSSSRPLSRLHVV